MKVVVNGNDYDVEIAGNKTKINGKEVDLKLDEDGITIDGKQFRLDFAEEGEPSLMIMNGIAYLVSKSTSEGIFSKELRAPISGEIMDVFVLSGSEVTRGQLLFVLEAMKMENQMKSPVKGRIKEVKIKRGQSVRNGDVLVTFE